MEDIFGETLKYIDAIEKMDGQVIPINDQTGTIAEKMQPSLSERLARSQTNEQAMDYARYEEFKQGATPANDEELQKNIDLQVEESIDKMFDRLG